MEFNLALTNAHDFFVFLLASLVVEVIQHLIGGKVWNLKNSPELRYLE